MAEADMTTAVFEVCTHRQDINNRQIIMTCMLLPIFDVLSLHANLKHSSSHPSAMHANCWILGSGIVTPASWTKSSFIAATDVLCTFLSSST